MFSLQPRDAVEVRLATAMDNAPVMIQVTKVCDKPFIAVSKKNNSLQSILRKGAAIEFTKSWIKNLPYTNIFEKLKQLKDNEYAEATSSAPQKRSRGYKAFILRLPETCTIEAPTVNEITGITIRVLLSCLALHECRCFGFLLFNAVLIVSDQTKCVLRVL